MSRRSLHRLTYRVSGSTGSEIELLALQAADSYGLDLEDPGLSLDYEISVLVRTMKNDITVWEADVTAVGVLRP